MPTWVVVGASRGIGLEWVRQLLARGYHVIATVRDVANASQLWALAGAADRGFCQLFECDVDSEASITVCGALRLLSSQMPDQVAALRKRCSQPHENAEN